MSKVRKYIGLSLSFCVQDILRNKVAIEDIAAIVTSTRFHTKEEAFDYYHRVYWSPYASAKDSYAVLNKVWGLVCQPRLNFNIEDHKGHMLSYGWWLNTFTGEITKEIK